ncbi:hypothetical protein MTsPCn5_22320 [Croceitalea sp. MTPC5]|uniref:DUF1569 domain-containing protein n=1 Tax=Croceitalea sp. MTPC5 TaxID=3056565 RepID=UPI002B37457D|nr:hypothetical protein MTsPCn5_22320 [Croceitalea sp. MTPC5]
MKKVGLALLVIVLIFMGMYLRNNRESNGDFLDDELAEIENYLPKRDVLNIEVSQADVAWHLDYMLKTINQISKTVQDSNPEEYEYSFSLQQVVVHTLGMIPRGAAQSPKSVRPPEVILTDSINVQLKEARHHIAQLNSLNEKAYFNHPVFNTLDRDQTRRFLAIHTKHHLKIIKDILKE